MKIYESFSVLVESNPPNDAVVGLECLSRVRLITRLAALEVGGYDSEGHLRPPQSIGGHFIKRAARGKMP